MYKREDIGELEKLFRASVAFALTLVTSRLSCIRAFSRGEDDLVNYSGVRGG